jgi:hypothetical protein
MPMRRTIRRASGSGVHDASELCKNSIAHYFDDPSAVLAHRGFKDEVLPLLQGGQRANLIRLHQAGVSCDVCHQNGSEPALLLQKANLSMWRYCTVLDGKSEP